MNTNLSSKDILELAIAKHQKQDLLEAEKLYQKVLNKDKNNFNANFLLGTLFASIKKFESAIIRLEKAKALNPNNADTHNNLGNVYKELNNIKFAKENYFLALKIDSKHINAIDNLGTIYLQEKELNLAEENFKKAISIDSNFVNSHYNLGLTYVKLGKLLQAKDSFLKVIKIIPNFVFALNALGNVNSTLEKTDEAIYYYGKVAQLQPNFKNIYLHLANLYKATGDFKKSLSSLKLGLKFDPDNLLIYNDISFLDEKTIDTELQSKIIKIINSDKCSEENLVYGNFILSKYENKIKNYNNELKYLYKAHQFFFKLLKNQNEFKKDNIFWFKKVPERNEFFEFKLDKKKEADENKSLYPIFLIGLPRSGSTLVEKLISSCDSNIKIGEETCIITNFISNQIDNNQNFFDNIQIAKKKIISDYFDKSLITNKKINIFTDKTLSNFFFVKFIIEIFPNAKFIICSRNPVASIISILKANLTKISWAHNLTDIFCYFDKYFSTIDKIKSSFSDYIYEIKYEKLVVDQETELKNLFKFCKLTWNQKCLEFYKDNFVSLTASNIQVRRPIFKDSINIHLNYKIFLDKYGSKHSWWSR